MTGGWGGSTERSAPAKLTLSLKITGVRSDGYHLLESEMVTVDLADRLVIGEGDGLTIETEIGPRASSARGSSARGSSGRGSGGRHRGNGSQSGAWGPPPLVPGPGNLVSRALAAVDRSARVHLVKRVPPGAGLGGGSADAAAILRWAGCSDLALAAHLGADVPFCLSGGRALVGGIGESVEPLPFEERSFVLMLLPFGVDTGAAYRAWDAMTEPRGPLPAPGPGTTSARPDSNDLERPALAVEPRMGPWREHFSRVTGRPPRLAGSGSTWFVEGTPEELGLGDQRTLQWGEETALLVPVRTTPGPE